MTPDLATFRMRHSLLDATGTATVCVAVCNDTAPRSSAFDVTAVVEVRGWAEPEPAPPRDPPWMARRWWERRAAGGTLLSRGRRRW